MNTEEAIKDLEKVGIKVDFISKNKYRVWTIGGEIRQNWRSWRVWGEPAEFWTGRQIIKLSKAYTSSSDKTAVSKALKSGDKVNRRIVRDAIKTEKFEDIPQNGQPFKDDRWNYD